MQRERFLQQVLLGLALAVISAWGVSDIRNTPHNLTMVPPELRSKQDEKEVCVFCHTPSASMIKGERTTLVYPLWDRSVDSAKAFVTYDDIGKAGFADADETVGSQSIACLSCHDASQAFGVSNMFSLDHPFGVPYRGVRAGAVRFADALASEDRFGVFKAAKGGLFEDFRPPSSGKSGKRQIWWVPSDGYGGARRGKNDLPLYVRADAELDEFGSPVPRIECSSCHDPHSENQLFLRQPVAGSRLCLTCHDK